MNRLTFEQFTQSFKSQYDMTETSTDGKIEYHFEDEMIEVNPSTLIALLTDEQKQEMLDRCDASDEVAEIIYSEITLDDKIEELEDAELLNLVFDDIALDQAESTDGFKEILRDLYDKVYPSDVKSSRLMTGMSQKKFSEYFNIPVRTIEDWEAGRRQPPKYVEELILYKVIKEGLDKK